MYDYYIEETRKLRNVGKSLSLTDNDVDRIIEESFRFLEHECNSNKKPFYYYFCKKKTLILLSAVIACIAVLCVLSSSQRNTVHGYVVRNFQVLVHPAMKLLRKIMLPVIEKYPRLTELYDEACLIGNPYFQVSDLDCWPCENVRSILNLTSANLSKEEYHSGIPFVFRDGNIRDVTFKKLSKMYFNNKYVFDTDAGKIHGTNPVSPEHLFLHHIPLATHIYKNLHFSWKINRLEPVRVIRKTFGLPLRTPSYVSGITIEKWISIDGPKADPYELPYTEGTTVFVIQGGGSRLITLEPSPECVGSCHKVSILLRPKHILWYNWWYWRAKSLPVGNSNKIGITYVGSFY